MKDNDKSFCSTLFLCDDDDEEEEEENDYSDEKVKENSHPLGVSFKRKRFLITQNDCLFVCWLFLLLRHQAQSSCI
jgi:hypothetical protein